MHHVLVELPDIDALFFLPSKTAHACSLSVLPFTLILIAILFPNADTQTIGDVLSVMPVKMLLCTLKESQPLLLVIFPVANILCIAPFISPKTVFHVLFEIPVVLITRLIEDKLTKPLNQAIFE